MEGYMEFIGCKSLVAVTADLPASEGPCAPTIRKSRSQGGVATAATNPRTNSGIRFTAALVTEGIGMINSKGVENVSGNHLRSSWLRGLQATAVVAMLTLLPVMGTAQSPLPASRRAQAGLVSSEEAQNTLAKRIVAPTQFPAPNLSTAVTSEIQELARALKNDPNLIYQYVYDRVEYTPIYGSLKGAAATLLDGKGNDFDQCSLMIALLRQAGFTANFIYGQIRVYPAQLTNWLGVTASPNAIGWLLGSAGIPATTWTYPDNSLAFVDMDHVWVSVHIGINDYSFDPSLKTNTYTAGINLPAAMGYNQATFLSNALAGATSTSSYLQNVNSASLRGALTGYATNLVNYIRSNSPAASLDQIIGGKSIIPVQAFPRQSSLPYQQSVLYQWTDIPAQYKTTLRIQHLGIDVTLLTEDIYGKRLTVFYDGSNRPVLRLDGTTLGTGSSAPLNSSQSLILSVDHPYAANGGTYGDESQPQTVTAGGTNAYFIVNGWAGTGKAIVDRHRRLTMENSFAGNAKTSEPVLGESLAALGSTWLAERSRADELSSRLYNTFIIEHHNLGICGQNQSPYVDLPLNLVSVVSANDNSAPEDALFFSSAGHGSAFEWGVIEQTQPDTAVSTVKLMDDANSRSNKLYDVTSANYASIKPLLRNYQAWEYSQVEVYLNSGWRVLLPDDGNNGEGQWSGMGFLAITPDQSEIAHIINGGLKGGYGIDPWLLDPLLSPDDFFFDDHPASPEPIDLATGDYTYGHTDLSLGNGPYPFSLQFKRSYNSGGRLQDGPVGLGWTHNFNITTAVLSDGFKGMGADSPLDAAAAIAELCVAGDVLQGTKTKEHVIIATLCHRWFMDQQIKNVVSIRQPQESLQFVKLPGGGYSPQPGVAAGLTLKTNNSYQARLKHGELLDFDTSGRILTWTDPNSNTMTFAYSGGLLQSVNNGMSRSFSFTYSGSRISRVTDSAGRTVSFAYDSSGDLTNSVDAAGQPTKFQYDTPGRLARIFYPANPNTPFVSNVYDSLGRVMTQTDAQTNTYQYFFSGYRNEELNPLSNSHALYLTSYGKATSDIDALSNKTVNVYDGQRRLVSRTLPEGNATLYQYDSSHNIVRLTLIPKPGSTNTPIVKTFIYDPVFNRLTQSVDPLGRTNALSYDAQGNLLTITGPAVDSLVPQTLFSRNIRGQVIQTTDPSGRVRSSSYDPTTGDLLTTTIDPGGLNITKHLDYDVAGNVLHSIDPSGHATTFTYDTMRRLTQRTAPSPFNYISTNRYDADGRLIEADKQTSDPVTPWRTTTFSYTPAGQKHTETNPRGNTATYQYDQAERLSVVTDAAGHTTQYQYDSAGRLYRVIDALGHTNEDHLYTPNGKLLSLKDANGNLTTYQYDSFDRVYRTLYPDSSYEQFVYDAMGNIVQKLTRAGQTISFTYDNLNRLWTKAPPGATDQFAYDLAGRMVDATDSNGTTHRIYDNAGRLSSVTYPGSATVAYQYDASGNRTILIYPDGYFVTCGFDALNRLTQVLEQGTNLLAQYGYDALSHRTNATYGNGTSAAYNYQIDNHLAAIANEFSGSGANFNYAYDKIGNRTSMEINDGSYLFKPVANSQDTYAHNNLNQYTTVDDVPYAHDGNGNLTSDGTNTCLYDAENRLKSTVNASYSVTNTYDPFGHRISKSANSITTTYVYDGSQVIMELNSSAQLIRRYVYGARVDEPVCMITGTTNYYYHFDGFGSVIALSTPTGTVKEKYLYNPFGKPVVASSVGNPYLYTGREYDSENGLYSYRARFYNPKVGRFMQPDPISYAGGFNLYRYAGNNPLNLRDPSGLAPEDGLESDFGTDLLIVGLGILGVATLEFGIGELLLAEDAALLEGADIADILVTDGEVIGEAGSSITIRELEGGLNEAEDLFSQLSQGGEVITDTSYPGTLVRLQNGGTVGLRTYSTGSPGTAATIDVNVPDIPITKIKFNP